MKTPITIAQISTLSASKVESITCFNSIVIVNDESSQPERLIWFLKTLDEFETNQLLAVSDHEGTISFLWDRVPPRFRNVTDVDIPDGDTWSIFKNYELTYDNQMVRYILE